MKKIKLEFKMAATAQDGTIVKPSQTLAIFELNLVNNTELSEKSIETIKNVISDITGQFALPEGETFNTQISYFE